VEEPSRQHVLHTFTKRRSFLDANCLFQFLAVKRGKDGSNGLTEHAARVDLWQMSNGMKLIDMYMAIEICAATNYSTDSKTSSEQKEFFYIFPPSKSAEFSGGSIREDVAEYTNSAGDQYEEYWILSCYRIPTLSFRVYVTPLNQNLWITLPSTSFIMFTTYKVYVKASFKNVLSFCLFFYSSLVNNCTNIPATLSKSKILRFIWIPWIFMCMIVNNCYVIIIMSHINVPNSGQPITNINQILCTNDDGSETFENYAEPFETHNETSGFNNIAAMTEMAENRLFGDRRSKKSKQKYNKAINFWKPTSHYVRLYGSGFEKDVFRDHIKDVVLQFVRSGGNGFLEKLKSYQNDDFAPSTTGFGHIPT